MSSSQRSPPPASVQQESPTASNGSGKSSLWENAMRGAQEATNYLLSFISTPPPPQSDNVLPKQADAEHEGSVLAAWQRKSAKPNIQKDSKVLLTGHCTIHATIDFESILSKELLAKIHSGVAKRFQICIEYKCLYTTQQNGYSMGTLLRNCKSHVGPVLLGVRTAKGSVIGAFASGPWTPHMGHFGTGECFLFHLNSNNGNDDVMAYYTTGVNDYYLFCDGTFIAAGVSEGKFGLWIDSELITGSSCEVATFGNPPLAQEDGENFTIDAVEVWGLSPP